MLLAGNARVLLISTDPWNGFRVSKHHYAEELAQMGHEVFFLNPVGGEQLSRPVVVQPTENKLVSLVHWKPLLPYRLKFHARPLFDLAMRRQAKMITRAIGGEPDIIWDFDISYNFRDLAAFGPGVKIFHAVDPDDRLMTMGDKGADLVLGVTRSILDMRGAAAGPAHVIPHGISRHHVTMARGILDSPLPTTEGKAKVAYVGNLERADIDWPVILKMARENSEAEFLLIGPFREEGGNTPVAELRALPNVRLTGPWPVEKVVALSPKIDIWLAAYDPAKSARASMNSHKLLEYLATGRSLLANRFDSFVGSDLVTMPDGIDNSAMPSLLSQMLTNRAVINLPQRQCARAAYALKFGYHAHLVMIQALLDEA
jgi:hypothetical protein